MEELLAYVGAELKKPQEEISDELVFLVNSRIKPPKPVTREDIFVRTMFLVSDGVNSYGGRFPLEELHKLAELVIDSPVMVGHTKEKLPIARNFKAEVLQKDGQNWVKVWFYWLKNSKDALSLRENMDHGIYKECSLGFVFEFPECSICGQDMRKCPHVPFKPYQTQDGEKEAYFNYRNVARVLETSLVYRGAVPNTSISDELGLHRKQDSEPERQDRISSSDLNSPDDQKPQNPEVRPFDFVPPTKPRTSDSTANVVFHLEDLGALSGEFLIEPRYDGIRSQIHKRGDAVKIFSVQGQQVQHGFPHLVQEILRSSQESFILDGELVKYKGNSRLSHREAASYLAQTPSFASEQDGRLPDDSHFRLKVFDLLYLNGEDKTFLPLEERKRILEEFFEDTCRFRKVKYEKATACQLSPKAEAMATSEGTMLKRSDSGYFEDQNWYEWRRLPDLDVLVAGSERNKGGSYNYICSMGTKENPVSIGTTYSTFLEAKQGEIIRVRVKSIVETDGRFVWHAPKVLDKRSSKREPDPVSVLRRMADRSPSKAHHPRFIAKNPKAADNPGSTAHKFVLQVHGWGNSEHHHLKFQEDDTAFGLTIFELDLEALGRGRRFLCEWKDRQDSRWMDLEGEIPFAENGVGENPSTRRVAHVKMLDSGRYRILEKQANLSRIQIEGAIVSGIYLVRKIKLQGKDRWLFWKRLKDRTVNGLNG